MFPQRGVTWIRDRVPFLSDNEAPSVRNAPLEMIEGVTVHDRLRLEEEGTVDREIDRLRHVGNALSRFSGIEDPLPLHLVVGGKLKSSGSFEFADCTKLKLVGIHPHREAAQNACKDVAQKTAGDATIRYFVGHVHRLVDPDALERERNESQTSSGPHPNRGAVVDGHAASA